MGLWPLEISYSFSAGIDFRRQNLTSKVGSRAERVNISISILISIVPEVYCVLCTFDSMHIEIVIALVKCDVMNCIF